jgi:tetrahydromethanopterin S-methyltransferase subunit G
MWISNDYIAMKNINAGKRNCAGKKIARDVGIVM